MIFWIDQKRNREVSDEEFLQDLSTQQVVRKYIRAEDPYRMLVDMVSAMLAGQDFYLLDNDFSDEELTRMGISVEEVSKTTALQHRLTVKTLQDVATGIQTQLWKSWLFTSGTTGLPKKVCHSYQSLGRNVRISKWHQKDVWAFAYRMSHMAGVQVLLQALANRNPLIYVFESTPLDVVNTIRQYGCTHISATPTFYRNILPYITDNCKCKLNSCFNQEHFSIA